MTESRIIVRGANGDVFADLHATPADRRHYIKNGYTVQTVAAHWTDDTVRAFARQEFMMNSIQGKIAR